MWVKRKRRKIQQAAGSLLLCPCALVRCLCFWWQRAIIHNSRANWFVLCASFFEVWWLSTNENNQEKRSFRELFSFSSLSLSLRPTKSHKICGCICEQAHITQLLLVNEPGIHSHVIFSRHLLRILTCLGFDVLLEGHVHDSKKDHDECPQEHEKRGEV